MLYVGLGDKERALASLEKGYAEHDLQMQFLKIDPHFDTLRAEQRFKDILHKLGLNRK